MGVVVGDGDHHHNCFDDNLDLDLDLLLSVVGYAKKSDSDPSRDCTWHRWTSLIAGNDDSRT